MKKIMLLSLLAATFIVSGCHHQGWRVQQSKVTVSGENGIQSADQSILVDQRTGESWILSVDGSEFYWKTIPKK